MDLIGGMMVGRNSFMAEMTQVGMIDLTPFSHRM
jgi:hypothetical protein